MLAAASWRTALVLAAASLCLAVGSCGSGASQSTGTSTSDMSNSPETTVLVGDADGIDPVPEGTLGVAWLNEGVVGTDAWTNAHAAGAGAVADSFGDDVQVEIVEQVGYGRDPTATIDELVAKGYRMIFATSFPLSEATSAAAERHPDVRFGQARGDRTSANLTTYSGADEEPLFLAGMAAAATSRSGTIGFIAAVPEPETVRHLNAFALGAEHWRPDVRVLASWTGAWVATDIERELGRALVDAGADVLATGSVSTATGDLADELGIAWVGHDADHHGAYPRSWVTAAVPRWDRYYVQQVAALLDGSWTPEAYYGSMADGFTTLATLGEVVPPDARAAIRMLEADLQAGEFDVFGGPLTDQAGRTRVDADGELSFEERMTFDWLVEGITGQIPPEGTVVDGASG